MVYWRRKVPIFGITSGIISVASVYGTKSFEFIHGPMGQSVGTGEVPSMFTMTVFK